MFPAQLWISRYVQDLCCWDTQNHAPGAVLAYVRLKNICVVMHVLEALDNIQRCLLSFEFVTYGNLLQIQSGHPTWV